MSETDIRRKKVEESIQAELQQARKNAFGAIEYGKDTMEALELQDESLRSIEDTLEANEHVLDKSMKTMRGMTWSGFLYNQCAQTKDFVMGSIPVSNNPVPSSTTNSTVSKTESMSVSTTPSVTSGGLQNRDELDDISAAVATLHKMSVDIGQQLDAQNETIENISHKTEKVTEKTLAVTIRASQLSDRTHRRRPQPVGVLQLIDTVSGKYLGVADDRLILQERPDRSTYFTCFVKESHLFALRNEKTLKFVGCAMLGHIIVEATGFGPLEECYIDLSGGTTGILFTARHWGAGAWLKRPLADLREAGDATPPAHPYLTDTTTAMTDKAGRIEFRVVRVAAKDVAKDDK